MRPLQFVARSEVGHGDGEAPVFDLPERPLMVTEHQASIYRCENCRGVTKAAFPDGVVKQLVEESFEAMSSRKQRATPAVARIFDGEKEAKLIALACSKPAQGPRALDLAVVGKQGRGAPHCRSR